MFYWTVNLSRPKTKGHTAVAMGHKLYCFGGDCDEDQIGVRIFNTVSLSWMKFSPVTNGREGRHPEVPSNRWGHTTVLIEYVVYIWGGEEWNTGRNCNLYAFDVDSHRWFKTDVYGTAPAGRSHHSACVLGKVMYINGGYDSMTTERTNDIYKLDTTTMVWSFIDTRTSPEPLPSSSHTATIIGTKMFVFGGFGHWDNDIRVFDTGTNCWLSRPSAQILPEARYGHSAFAYNGELYIVGGFNKNRQSLKDLWKFNPKTISWKRVEPKGKYLGPMGYMCCCMVGDRVILFGGEYAFTASNGLCILDLSPSLKMLCKVAVTQYRLEQSELPHNIRWELAAMT